MSDTIPQNTTQKQCCTCKQFFPATKEHFYGCKSNKDGIERICKACSSNKGKKYRENNPDKVRSGRTARIQRNQIKREQAPDLKKKCNKCQNLLPATTDYFHKDPSDLYGLKNTCKVCRGFKYTLGMVPKTCTPRRKTMQLPDDERQCTKCLHIFPATEAYFYRESNNKDGLTAACKRCRGKGKCRTFGIKRSACGEDERQCTRCLVIFPKTLEYFHKKTSSGLNSVCKECRREIYQSQKIKINDTARAMRRAYPERYHQYEKSRVNYKHNRHIHRKGISGTHTAAQIADLLKRQRYQCYYAACGHAKFEKRNGKYVYHIDHTFPLSRVAGTDTPANDIGYLVLACPLCNLRKHDKFPWEWPEGGRLL